MKVADGVSKPHPALGLSAQDRPGPPRVGPEDSNRNYQRAGTSPVKKDWEGCLEKKAPGRSYCNLSTYKRRLIKEVSKDSTRVCRTKDQKVLN